jgi:hypothetical protein
MSSAHPASLRHLASCDTVSHRLSISSVRHLAFSVTSRLPCDTPANLWPQPYTQHPGAHEKDWLENRLHKEVCNGDITLEGAQEEIKTDWYAAYLKRKNSN